MFACSTGTIDPLNQMFLPRILPSISVDNLYLLVPVPLVLSKPNIAATKSPQPFIKRSLSQWLFNDPEQKQPPSFDLLQDGGYPTNQKGKQGPNYEVERRQVFREKASNWGY